MAEYIERKAAHDAVVDAIWHGKRSMYSVANAINSVPSADVAPVRHGKWNVEWDAERDQKRLFVRIVCSNCGLKTGQKSNYCPNCGARMDLEV